MLFRRSQLHCQRRPADRRRRHRAPRARALGAPVCVDPGALRHPATARRRALADLPGPRAAAQHRADTRLFVLLACAVADLCAAGRIGAGNRALAATSPDRDRSRGKRRGAVPAGHAVHVANRGHSDRPAHRLRVAALLCTGRDVALPAGHLRKPDVLQSRPGRCLWRGRVRVRGGGLRLLRHLVHLGVRFFAGALSVVVLLYFIDPRRTSPAGGTTRQLEVL